MSFNNDTNFYRITEESMKNKINSKDEIIPGIPYVWVTNGHLCPEYFKELVPMKLNNYDGKFKDGGGVTDASKLEKCTKQEAYAACWKYGKFGGNWYDYINGIYAEEMVLSGGKPITLEDALNLVYWKKDTSEKKQRLITFWEKEHFEYIQNPIYREFMLKCGWDQKKINFIDY